MNLHRTISLLVLLSSVSWFAAVAQTDAPKDKTRENPPDASAQVPSISADRGDCSADFDVLDAAGKPVYQAAIHTLIRWGLAHKSDLTISTNYYGKAQFTHLPNWAKHPIAFDVKSGDKASTVYFDPANQCQAKFKVELK